MSEARARSLRAKFESLTNAAEMIRGHREAGFFFMDIEFDEVYQREAAKLCERLNKKAQKYLREYDALGIDINTEEG